MTSEVYFAPLSPQDGPEEIKSIVTKLFENAGFSSCFSKNDLTAVKVHFGESGNKTFVSPEYVGKVIEQIIKTGAKPYVTDANTLYFGSRANGVDHLNTAIQHRFTPEVVGAPIMIADGLIGTDSVDVEVNLNHFDKVSLASGCVNADAIMVVSHFKCHMVGGIGGALKNLGMGFGTRAGKQQMHSDINPKVDHEMCIGCGKCASHCPKQAITIEDGKATIDQETCYGCGECLIFCAPKAIKIRWDSSAQSMQEKMVEYCMGAIKGKEEKVAYINFVIDVTPHCDCLGKSDPVIVEDIGILASTDPVALDQACADLVNAAKAIPDSAIADGVEKGLDNIRAANDLDWTYQLAYGEQIGLGSRKYNLIKL